MRYGHLYGIHLTSYGEILKENQNSVIRSLKKIKTQLKIVKKNRRKWLNWQIACNSVSMWKQLAYMLSQRYIVCTYTCMSWKIQCIYTIFIFLDSLNLLLKLRTMLTQMHMLVKNNCIVLCSDDIISIFPLDKGLQWIFHYSLLYFKNPFIL